MHSSLGHAIVFGLPAARAFAIADSYDAMVRTDRPYRVGTDHERAIADITRLAGVRYDPALVVVFLGVPDGAWLDVAQR